MSGTEEETSASSDYMALYKSFIVIIIVKTARKTSKPYDGKICNLHKLTHTSVIDNVSTSTNSM